MSINPLSREGWFRSAARRLRRRLAIPEKTRIALAKLNRRNHPATFIAITGSSGKTTTTSLLAHILSGLAPTSRQIFSNALRGISGAVMRASRKDRFVVLEVAASGRSSVAQLAEIAKPDVAIVTMVGLEHYSAFRSLEAVAAEKGHLVAAVQPRGFAPLNADDEHVLAMRGRTGERIVTFGRSETADFRVLSTEFAFPGPLTLRIAWGGREETLTSPLPGSHFCVSVAAAFAAAVELGVPVPVAPAARRCSANDVGAGRGSMASRRGIVRPSCDAADGAGIFGLQRPQVPAGRQSPKDTIPH
ncbi:MAG: hypothetical protein J0H84_05020 [Rhizobiales bacterium]|nr:hypothetical protein [Hyphomicrobiales bacterium]